MKILIAIPSKNRVEVLKNYAWKWVSLLPLDFKIFVEPQDFNEYANEFGYEVLVDIQDNNRGLGYAKSKIKEYAIAHNYDVIFKLDDDVKAWTDWRTTLSVEESAKKIEETIERVLAVFQQYPAVKAVTFPYSHELYEKTMWEKTKRIQTAYIIRTDAMHTDPRISVFEDFAAGLSIFVNRGMILKFGLSAMVLGVKVGGGSGGHQDFDRAQAAKNEVALLREIYPPLQVRGVDKPWQIEPDIASVKV